MKKELFFIAGVAAIFVGCARETEVATPETGRKHITIQASLAPETKTTVEITNGNGVYSWAEEETIAVIESEASEVTQFTVSNAENGYFEGTIASGNTLLGAVSPESAITEVLASEGEVVYSLEFSGSYSADQTNAILVAAALEKIQSQDAQDPLYKFQFKHVGGLMKVTYTNIPVGTKALRYTTNQNIVGEVKNLESLTGVEVTTSDLDGGMTAVVNFATPVSTPNTTHVFYVPVPTGNYGSFEIALLDDAGTVIPGTLRSKTQNFTVARTDIIKIPTVTLPLATLTNKYVKVTSNDNLTDGVYLIVNEDNGVAFDGSLETLDAVGNTVAVTISNEKTIASSSEVDAATFTINVTNGTILSSSKKYIGQSTDANALTTSDSAMENAITIDENEDANVVSEGGAHLRYNSASNQLRFRYYKSSSYTGQNAIQLYKHTSVSTLIDPALSFSPASVSISDADYGSFVAPALTNAYHVPVVWSSSDENEDYAMLDTETGEVLLTGVPGTFTITASSAASSVFAASSASYTVTVTSSAPGYVKVTSAPADWSGQYLIVYETANLAFDGSLTTLDAVGNSIAVTITNGKIESNATTNAAAFTIASVTGGYSIKSASGYYIGKTAKGNGMDTSESDAYVNTLAYDNSVSVVSITSSGGLVLKYNSASNQNRFRYYGSGQQDIQLYKLEDNRPAAPIFWSASTAIASIGSSFSAPALTNTENLAVTYESSVPAVATIDASGNVIILAEGVTEISATYDGNASGAQYKSTKVSYTLTVQDNRPTVETPTFSPVAGEVVTGTTVTISTATSGATIYYTTDNSEPTTSSTQGTAVTIDAAKTIKAIAVKEGYKNSAVAIATYTTRVATVGSGTAEDPYTAGDILAKYATVGSGESQVYVTGTVAEVTEVSTQHHNATYTITDGENTITVYRGKYLNNTDFTSAEQINENDVVVVCGKISLYQDTPQVAQGNYLVSIVSDPNAPTLSVSPETSASAPASWAADNDDAKSFTVTATNGTWSYDDSDVTSWATVTKNGDVLNVTPKAKQAADNHSGTIVITLTPSHSGYESKTATIHLAQAKYSEGGSDHTATIKFGSASGSTNVNGASVTGNDSEGNTWTVTTVGTESFTPYAEYAQIGSSKKPATSITFTTTLAKDASIKRMSAKFGGFSGTAGTVSLKVGDTTVGTGSLNATTDVTVNATDTSVVGKVLTVTVTGISKGVKAYEISVTYNN